MTETRIIPHAVERKRSAADLESWMRVLAGAGPNEKLEVGIAWHHATGWHVFQQISGKILILSGADARRMHRIYKPMMQAVEWQDVSPAILLAFAMLGDLGKAAIKKTRAGEIPPNVLKHLTPKGEA